MVIKTIRLREILDSRGNPTIEAEVSSQQFTTRAAAPSGASVGKHEVPAFPDKGTAAAIQSFQTGIEASLIGHNASYREIDRIIKDMDTTRQMIGGNTSIAVSLAVGKLQAREQGLRFYELFTQAEITLPHPLGNVIGGGVHAGKGSPEIQEFLSIPVAAPTFKKAALANSRVHKIVGQELIKKYPEFTRGRDDEGAWAPAISNEEALAMLSGACQQASDEFGFEIRPALDLAASEFWDAESQTYSYKTGPKKTEDQIAYVEELIDKYNLFYVEDPLHEDDFEGFARIKNDMGARCLIVGDDLITTNPERLQTSIENGSANSLIIKPNQIGSLSETEDVVKMAKANNYKPTLSHRSGETEDTSIAHLAVGFNAPIIKTGIIGGERLAKLNELIRIEEHERGRAKMAKI
jgi:enolase